MRWLHISDLHYHPGQANFDTRKMLKKFKEELAELRKSSPGIDMLLFTGDFRFAGKQPATEEVAQAAVRELQEIAKLAGGPGGCAIHIVPGNHDYERLEKGRETPVLQSIYEKYDYGSFAGKVMLDGEQVPSREYLLGRFGFFSYAAEELGDAIWKGLQSGRLHRTHDYGDYALVYLNTAVACGRKDGGGERGRLLIGYNDLADALEDIPKGKPIIALGHHGLENLDERERRRVREMFRDHGIRLYLCGDEHKGHVDTANDLAQMTAGCLTVGNHVEPVFYIGELRQDGRVDVDPYTYNTEHFGWDLSKAFKREVIDRLRSADIYAEPKLTGFVNREKEPLFGRDGIIVEIMGLIKPLNGTVVEVSGVAGVGKSCVCQNVLKGIGGGIEVNARVHGTVGSMQEQILRKLEVNTDGMKTEEFAAALLRVAVRTKKCLYIDNAETAIAKDRQAFSLWLRSFSEGSGWGILYSTQTSLDVGWVKPFCLYPLKDGYEHKLFFSRWGQGKALSGKEETIARDIAERLLSGLPLAIMIATSPAYRKNCSLAELKEEIENRVPLEFKDDPNDPHRSMSVALSLAHSEVSRNPKALLLWSMFAQYKGEFSDELFRLAFDGDPSYREARNLLRSYNLLTKYWMAEPVKEFAFGAGFGGGCQEEAFGVLCLALSRMFGHADEHLSGDRQFWHDVAIKHLPAAMSLCGRAWHDGNVSEGLDLVIQSAQNYFKYLSNGSLQALRRAVPFYEKSGHKVKLANTLKSMGDLELRLGQPHKAQGLYGQAESLYRAGHHNLGLANTLLSMGDLERGNSNYMAALSFYESAYALYSAEETPVGLGCTTGELCRAYALAGNVEEAMKWLKVASDTFETMPEHVKPYVAECLKEAIGLGNKTKLLSKRLGRSLTDEEMAQFEIR